MASLLAAGITATQSGTFVLAAGESATLYLVGAAGTGPEITADARVDIQIQSAAGDWFTMGQLNTANRGHVLSAAGTWRVNRRACLQSVGVDKN